VLGLPMTVFLLLRDGAFLLWILCYHQGCRFGKVDELDEEEVNPDVRERVYNQTRSTVIALYKRIKKHIAGEGGIMDEER
jgi:hypothetical protein